MMIKHIICNGILFQNYDTTESKLRREFEVYGPIKRVCLVTVSYFYGHLFSTEKLNYYLNIF